VGALSGRIADQSVKNALVDETWLNRKDSSWPNINLQRSPCSCLSEP
jgi:hypothetical protein